MREHECYGRGPCEAGLVRPILGPHHYIYPKAI